MKNWILILAMGLLVTGCAGVLNSPAGSIYVSAKYPECRNESTSVDYVNCVKGIQEKEGKVR